MKSIQFLLFLSTGLVMGLLALVLALKAGVGGPVYYEEAFFCGITPGDFDDDMFESDAYGLIENHNLGRTLFQNNCSACHSYSSVIVGPALKGVTERRSKEWLIQFISSPMAMVESGDSTAVAVFNDFNKMMMPSFDTLSPAEIDSILTYISAHDSMVRL